VGRLFGTDGVRGIAGVDLTPELALALASAAVHELVVRRDDAERPRVVIGRDTRPSGEWLEAAVTAGCLAAGADVDVIGIIPTPGVAYTVATTGADLGVMISASHNPMPDNGIKFFARGGHKLADDVEDRIEARLPVEMSRPVGEAVGRRYDERGAAHRDSYVAHLLTSVTTPLDGLRVVVDCANGAASTVAPDAYRTAGADVVVINDDLSGYRINDGCGATHLEAVQNAVREHNADVGLAHDGDADRCIAVDANGDVVDGDAILAILALALQERGQLASDTVVTTVMTNLGFKRAMATHGVAVAETPVGDRYVLEEMRARNLVLGGEQSGHLILLSHSTTGDGLLTGLQLLARMAETGRSLAELAGVLRRLPQVLLAVRVQDKAAALDAPAVIDAIAAAEASLGADGRILVRPSGTEPVVRVMVEAPEEAIAQSIAERVATAVQTASDS
jgi:phosphoglucosamine mutase